MPNIVRRHFQFQFEAGQYRGSKCLVSSQHAGISTNSPVMAVSAELELETIEVLNERHCFKEIACLVVKVKVVNS